MGVHMDTLGDNGLSLWNTGSQVKKCSCMWTISLRYTCFFFHATGKQFLDKFGQVFEVYQHHKYHDFNFQNIFLGISSHCSQYEISVYVTARNWEAFKLFFTI